MERLAVEAPQPRDPSRRVEYVTDEVDIADQAQEFFSSTEVDEQVGQVLRIIRLPLPLSQRPQATVEEIKDEELPPQPSTKRQQRNLQPPPVVQFVDPPALSRSPNEPQQRIPSSRAVVEYYEAYLTSTNAVYDGPKETVAINMAKNKSRFQILQFLDAPVTMPIWQLLDHLPQVRAQLARAIASSKPSR